MLEKKVTDKIKRRKQLVTWLAGTVAMPFAAYGFVTESISPAEVDLPIILVFAASWAISSILLLVYIRQNVR